MCTASWLTHRQGYELYFNRDERLPAPRPAAAQRSAEETGRGCRVRVSAERVERWHAAGPPCADGQVVHGGLARRAVVAA